MADNVEVNSGTGIPVATDDCSGKHVQLMKLAYSADGDRTHIPADADGLLVNLGANNDITGTVDLGATDNAVLDAIAASLVSIDGAVGGGLTDTELRASPVVVDLGANNDVTVTGSVTANAGTNLNTSALALESGGNLAGAATSLAVIDDWDESDRAKVNPIVGQAGVQGGSGSVSATTQRVVLATDVGLPAGANALGSVSVTGTVTVGSHAVTNAGTFAVQVDGSALTSLQLLDDAIVTIGTTTYTEATTKGTVVAAVRRDADTTLVDTTNEHAPLIVDARGFLKVEAFSGETLPVSLTSTTITGTVAVTQSGTWDEVGINDSGNSITVDAPTGTPVNVQIGDGTRQATVRDTGSSDSLNVAIVDGSGNQITSFGGGTQYTEDAAAAADPVGNALILVRNDTLAGLTTTDGDNVAARGTDKGELYVKQTDAVPVTDNSGSLSVDWNGTQPVTGSGNATGALRVELANNGTGVLATVGTVTTVSTVSSVSAVIPGTGATNLGKAEDSQHSSTDVGVMALQVRNDADASFGADLDYTPMSCDAGGNANIRPRPPVERQSVTSGGLTTSSTAYTAGDMLGNQFTFANMARKSGAGGYLTNVVLVDETDIIGACDVVFFISSVTPASDNATAAWSDSDMLNVVAVVPLSGAWDLGNNHVVQSGQIRIPYICSGSTNLYASIITRTGHTFFGATTSLKLICYYETS